MKNMTVFARSDLVAGYEGGFALRELSCSVAEGEFVGLIGPNGAGKSTLLKVLGGLIVPTRGEARLFERPVAAYSRRELARLVGGVMQEQFVPFDFRVEETVLLGRTAHLGRFEHEGPEDFAAVEQAMRLSSLEQLRGRKLSQLSGGELQRVLLAQALAQQPKVLLLDEPTSHLDLLHQLELMEILVDLNRTQGLTLIIALHDLNLASRYCNRLMALKEGRLLFSGAPAEVVTRPRLVELYGVDAEVRTNPVTGRPEVLMGAARPAWNLPSASPKRVHVFCGGGSAAQLLFELARAGFDLSAGPVNLGDSDYQMALELGAEVAPEQPFSPLGEKSLAQAEALAQKADACVLAAMPFGWGNLAVLELVERLQRQGKVVVLAGDFSDKDFTEARRATQLLEALKRAGALSSAAPGEVVRLIEGLLR